MMKKDKSLAHLEVKSWDPSNISGSAISYSASFSSFPTLFPTDTDPVKHQVHLEEPITFSFSFELQQITTSSVA